MQSIIDQWNSIPVDWQTLIVSSIALPIFGFALLKLWKYFTDKPELLVSSDKAYIDRLPPIDTRHFVGREETIQKLDKAWEKKKIAIFVLFAWGGAGKTAVISKWLQPYSKTDWKKMKHVYAWSFQNQGDIQSKYQPSSSEFIDHALKHFDNDISTFHSEYLKGELLAKLIAKRRCLLILDGIEAFQYADNLGDTQRRGELRDQALRGLLDTLAKQTTSMCLISSREPLNKQFSQAKNITNYSLDKLSEADSIQLLKRLKVKGAERDLKDAVKDYDYHAYSLTLLGQYMAGKDIRKRDIELSSNKGKKHQQTMADGLMLAYQKRLQAKNPSALALLYVLSLFDKAVELSVIEHLIDQADACGKFVHNLKPFKKVKNLHKTINYLQKIKLLRYQKDADKLSCHPLVSQFFQQQFKNKYPYSLNKTHKVLYRYYKDLPEKQQPDTLEEMQPLFAAIAHGCAAGMYQQALADVYYSRIRRKGDNYLCKKLGAFGSDLSALSHFFSQHWHTPAAELEDSWKAFSFAVAAFNLRALGRLQEAVQPTQTGLEMWIKQESWRNAASTASNLSQLQLTRGVVVNAITTAQQSVEFAGKSGDVFSRMAFRTTPADAQYQAGELANAQELFEKAESLQKERQAEFPQLYSLWGFRYCELLLTARQWQKVQQRADYALGISTGAIFSDMGLLDIALDQLSLGRASLQQAITSTSFPSLQRGNVPYPDAPASSEGSGRRSVGTRQDCSPTGGFALAKEYQVFTTLNREKNHEIEPETSQPRLSLQSAENWLNKAVGGLRKAGVEHHIPRGLLVRACCYRFCLSLPPPSRSHRSSVGTETVARMEPSEIRGNPPALRKLHAGYAEKAIQNLQETHDIAQRGGMLLHLCDYHLESARLALTIDQPVFELTASEHTQKAKQLIDDTGYKRRLPEVEYLEALL